MRTAFVCALLSAALAVSACASGQVVGAPPAARIAVADAASIRVTERGGARAETVMTLQNALQADLLSRGVFRTVKDDGTDAPVRIDIALVDVKEVSQGTRSFMGAFAGAAHLTADIRVYDQGRQVDTFRVETKSSSGHVMAGTTLEAATIMAAQIADRLAAYSR